jgi:hypothetical protein
MEETCVSDDHSVVQISDSWNFIYKQRNLLTMKNLKMGYFGVLLVGIVTAFSLYLDYTCDSNFVVPQDYIYFEHKQDNMSTHKNSRALRDIGSDVNLLNVSQFTTFDDYECQKDADCKSDHATCKMITDIHGAAIGSKCVCANAYLTVQDNQGICQYHQLAGLTALLISIFVGPCGVDRCFLA